MEPALTTVRIPAERIGQLGGKAIVQAIAEASSEFMIRNRVEVELIMRGSTGLAPGLQR